MANRPKRPRKKLPKLNEIKQRIKGKAYVGDGVKELINLVFKAAIDNTSILLIFFAIATPLGLNTIVYPEAYGGDPETGASMAMISHTLSVITIPLMYLIFIA